MYIYLHNCSSSSSSSSSSSPPPPPCKIYPETGVVTVCHLWTVPVACGRCCGLGWTHLRCLCGAALFGGVHLGVHEKIE
jgi:hypothetical protein